METTQVRTKWIADTSHSEIFFKVKHLMITNVKGEFRKFSAVVESGSDDFEDASVRLDIDASSIFTNNDDRDAHLKGPDFFDATQYPSITFDSTSFIKLDDDNYKLIGLLTIKGISNEVALDVEFGGVNTDPYGNKKSGFSLTGSFNRKDWGLNWNATLETGGVLVSDEVRISAEVQFVKSK